MAGQFEDLMVWQKARALTRAVYTITREKLFARDFALRDQLRRAAVSIMSNIAEGHERASPAEFGRFVTIAKGSCGELRCQLYVARDQGYIDETVFARVSAQATEVSRMLYGLRRSLKSRSSTPTNSFQL